MSQALEARFSSNAYGGLRWCSRVHRQLCACDGWELTGSGILTRLSDLAGTSRLEASKPAAAIGRDSGTELMDEG
jgi:hypothetical protein